ncbi:MAG: NTP transferase domain-containing protein [Gemmatimonadetes bacterium]|nr:NTP transferase domain-containing protein [Gemmatimonadota bacterium]
MICVLPARMESTRLPGKPLKMIAGRTLIERSWHRAVKAFGPQPGSTVVVATDSRQIARAARRFGADVVMTSAHHGCGTERVEEAAALLRAGPGDVIVNFQGDEPFADAPAVLRAAERVGKQLERSPDPAKELIVATVAAPLRDEEERWSPSLVKVWPGREGRGGGGGGGDAPRGDLRLFAGGPPEMGLGPSKRRRTSGEPGAAQGNGGRHPRLR